jgi:FKBP-type peptidyl-prolyl cis-trans isomerase (trigger factor)
MKVNVKKIEQNKRALSIEVSGELVNKKFEEIYARIAKEAKIPGFRPGKAPRDILQKHYSAAVHQEVLKGLIPEVYGKAVESEKLDVIELPEISDVKLTPDALSFTATVELKPEIEVKGYKGIKIEYKDIEVTAEQVKAKLEALKESRKIENIDDAFARSLGYPGVAQLEKALQAQIYLQKENEQRIKTEQEIIKHLTKTDFRMPVSLVERQLKEMVGQAKMDLALKGVAQEEIEHHQDKLNEQLKPEAEQRVKVYLLLEAIAKKENIALDEHMPSRTIEFLMREADWQKAS